MRKIDVMKFDKVAREVFAPVYPVIAAQIVQSFGIRKGVCLDIGSGGGYLALALARITELFIYVFDYSPEMLSIASQNIANAELAARMQILKGDVHQIPLQDGSVNLVVSRGSFCFWEDQQKAFGEIYRVLAPGGMGYIGGGFGTTELKKQIIGEMWKKYGKWYKGMEERRRATNTRSLEEKLQEAGILTFKITRNDTGLWIKIWK